MALKSRQKKPPIRIAGSAEASVGSATTGRDIRTISDPAKKSSVFLEFLCLTDGDPPF